jgi:hypothetical protein
MNKIQFFSSKTLVWKGKVQPATRSCVPYFSSWSAIKSNNLNYPYPEGFGCMVYTAIRQCKSAMVLLNTRNNKGVIVLY